MQKLFAIIALLCIAHQPLHAQVVQELNTRSAVKVMVVKDGIGIPQVAALPTNPALLNYNSTAATGSPVWCSCAADTLRRGLNIWNGTAWETIRAAELPGTINWLDSTGETQGRPLFTTVGNRTTTSPYYLFSSTLRKLVINSTNISHGGNDKRFVVNGRALINDLYLEAETINTGPPSGSATYPLGWNPSTQQVEKYTEWPGGISYPYTTGKYLNAYGTFAPLISDSVPEGSTNLYFTNARARAAIGLTTTGSSGAATYNNTTGILNIPNYTLAGLGGVPTSRTITINGTAFDLSADRSWTISGGGGGITGIGAFASTGDAKGLSISGTDLIMHPATATTPGGVSTGDQTWAGVKTLLNAPILSASSNNTKILFNPNTTANNYMGIGTHDHSLYNELKLFVPSNGIIRLQGNGRYVADNKANISSDWFYIQSSGFSFGVPLIGSLPFSGGGVAKWNGLNSIQNAIVLADSGNTKFSGITMHSAGSYRDMKFHIQDDVSSQTNAVFRWYRGNSSGLAGTEGLPTDYMSLSSSLFRVNASRNTFTNKVKIGGTTQLNWSILDIESNSAGVYLPRLTTAQATSLGYLNEPLLIFTNKDRTSLSIATEVGFGHGYAEIYGSKYVTASNADYTLDVTASFVNLPDLTANRVLTLPSASTYYGKTIIIKVANSAAFTWSTSVALKDKNDADVTSLTNDTIYTIFSNGSSWLITSIY